MSNSDTDSWLIVMCFCMFSDGESNECSGTFSLSNFWEILSSVFVMMFPLNIVWLHSDFTRLTRVLIPQVKLLNQHLRKRQNSVWCSRSRRCRQRRCVWPHRTYLWPLQNINIYHCVSCSAVFLSVFASVMVLVCFFSLQGCAKMAESVQKSVLTLSTVYFWLPKSQGNWH